MMLRLQTRPGRFRPILTTVLVLIGLFLIWLGIEIFFALTARANPTVDYGAKLMQQAAEWQRGTEADDVWDELVEAVDLHHALLADLQDDASGTLFSELEWSYDAVYRYDAIVEEDIADLEWTSGRYESEAEALEALNLCRSLALESLASWEDNGIAARLDLVVGGTHAVRPMPNSTHNLLLGVLLPELGELRKMARGLKAQMVISRGAGDWEAYTTAFERALAIGRIECSQQFLIERLVGIAIRALMFGQVRDDLLEGRLPSEALEMIEAAMQRQSEIPPMSYTLAGERAIGLDMIQWLHDSRGRLMLAKVSAFEDYSGTGNHPIVNVASIAYPRKDKTEDWIRNFYSTAEVWYDLPVHERRSGTNPILELELELAESWRYPIQNMLIPALGRAASSSDLSKLDEVGLLTLLAIERYRHDVGRLPSSLEVLVPDYLEESPIDPFGNGESFLRYTVLDEPDESGRDYLLYSVGYDDLDNHGKPGEDEYTALRHSGKGTDFVINQKRE